MSDHWTASPIAEGAYVWHDWQRGYDQARSLSVEEREALMAREAGTWNDSRWRGFLVGHNESSRAATLIRVRQSIVNSLELTRSVLPESDLIATLEANLAECERELEVAHEQTAEPSEDAN